jgi:hypothetical protein
VKTLSGTFFVLFLVSALLGKKAMKKTIILLLCFLGFAGVARSHPIAGAVVQTWNYDPQSGLITMRILNTSDKDITALAVAADFTVTDKAGQDQVSHVILLPDFLVEKVLLDMVRGTPGEENLRARLHAPEILPAGGTYEEKTGVPPGFKDFSATIELVVYADKTAEATNPDILQVVINARKLRASAIQKAQEIMAAHPDRLEAAAEAQKALDTWRATSPDRSDMDEGEFLNIVVSLKQNPNLKALQARKEREKAFWTDQANLIQTGGRP